MIADIFHKVHYVEKWGTGISKIKNFEPKTKFEEVSDFFLVTFQRKNIRYTSKQDIEKFKITKDELKDKNLPKDALIDWLGESWENVGRMLGVNQLKIIIIMSANKEITIKELSTELDLSTTAIENNIRKLKEAEIIKRIGSDKEGYWEITTKFKNI